MSATDGTDAAGRRARSPEETRADDGLVPVRQDPAAGTSRRGDADRVTCDEHGDAGEGTTVTQTTASGADLTGCWTIWSGG